VDQDLPGGLPERSLRAALLAPIIALLEGIGTTASLTLQTVAWLFRPPFRFGQLLSAMEFLGVGSIFIIALTGTFSGMVLALQMFNTLKRLQTEGLVGAIVAIALAREMSPVFAALMVTARVGSAWAAELGNMRITEQIDAITTMGVSPVQYLLAPRVLSSVLMLPLLCVVYTCVGMAGAWLVAVDWLGVDPGVFIAKIRLYAMPKDFIMGEIKAAVFGFLVAAISCRQGYFASGGARGVGIATTKAVVHSAVATLVANYILTSWLTD
jgi:phospholipid/cholesterol/gamma-HCH transport system permease protein